MAGWVHVGIAEQEDDIPATAEWIASVFETGRAAGLKDDEITELTGHLPPDLTSK